MFNTPEMAPLRGEKTPVRPFGHYDAMIDGGWQVPGEPYTNRPGTEGDFWWWRSRMLGGRTNHWGRISLRFGEFDFKPKSRDGLGVDWPMSYDDIAPWYDRVGGRVAGGRGRRGGITGRLAKLHLPRLTSNSSGAWISTRWPTALVTTYCSFSKCSSCLSNLPATGVRARTMSCATEGFSAMTRVLLMECFFWCQRATVWH